MGVIIRKHIHVACAIIERDGLVLAARRSASMSFPLKWEFPGGKIDPGESPQECLHRELLEEMGVSVWYKGGFAITYSSLSGSFGHTLSICLHHSFRQDYFARACRCQLART